ncbi:allantoate amidohydrolase [Cellulomonas fimi]|uniref:Amidase, hydantoinase/carbamoylase family n=1 Tax=Cellulomonas fimi (strain ATCC 484 / DSM 20113 / JCM 1341 / CCUG 24087 / LMG 16345 / NBRC 15513 / NCIMB 8980 / NCTC 7547 / NRS-133) TaxID=590998 RepID=F4H3Z9_CELFA|nr:allantoate amidohydrolase [Cellulomonas fimi]AEE44223.1 amidase, hydantoinase/carbamoylase family [Cellulomonas fimi ATCC 484]NNH05671.1 allantoate amidohydrolase [Cellulomonas fimi]VEH25916.1 N-carbamoyl-L-amino acid hydrolase [Cellulomonas fimi]
MSTPAGVTTFRRAWDDLAPVGRDGCGAGYRRFAWTRTDHTLRQWFAGEAAARGLDLVVDRAGNQWAWWGDPDARPGVVTGSHLDSVPGGGAFDGPLGVVSAFAALDVLRERGVRPARPLGLACFADEEGARFGVACAGSRLLTGVLDADRARALRDADGTTLADALRTAGRDPSTLGPDREALARVGAFVELHVEQGRGLVHAGVPVGVGRMVWPHGRWRVDLRGEANHAGTTPLADRHDPMLDLAAFVRQVRDVAVAAGALATVGKVRVEPNGVNAIPSQVTAWLDVRAEDERRVREALTALAAWAPVEESWTPVTWFDADLADEVASTLGGPGLPARGTGRVPLLGTGAGHDAGILAAAGVPTAMLFVRNPTGVSHAPAESADEADCLAGVDALATTLAHLLTRDAT